MNLKHLLLGASVSLIAFNAMADEGGHGHEGDIDAVVEDGKIEIESGILLAGGSKLFETEFGEFGNDYVTDEPGFILDAGSLTPGQVLGYQILNPLSFWDGTNWISTTPGSETITISDSVGAPTVVSDSSIIEALGFIEYAGADGGVSDTHLDFEISNPATTGAYLLELVLVGYEADLTTNLNITSDTFFIAFNFGMDEEDYEASIDALAPVPVPAAWLLMLSGLAPLALRRLKA